MDNKKIIYKSVSYSDIKINHNKEYYMPVLSFFIDNEECYYSDICIPNIDDWILSNNKIYPIHCKTIFNNDLEDNLEDIKYDPKIYNYKNAPNDFNFKFIYYFNKMFPKDLLEKIQMDEVASFSVTESKFADDISKKY